MNTKESRVGTSTGGRTGQHVLQYRVAPVASGRRRAFLESTTRPARRRRWALAWLGEYRKLAGQRLKRLPVVEEEDEPSDDPKTLADKWLELLRRQPEELSPGSCAQARESCT